MSKSIEERVVQMEFENESFETKAAQTTKTLEQLDEKLKFKNGSKSFEDVQAAAEKTNFKSLIAAADTVTSKLSNLGIVGVTALTNITNKAVDAGTSLVKSLTIDQVAEGWNKMDQITKATGTLVSQGYDLAQVNEQLDKLNWFTDETSYNLSDMVSNISKFTAQGIDLETSTQAMEGIALWAAMAGQNAQAASHTMRQLSQSLGAGYVRREDWNSVVTMQMDTEQFRQTALQTAVAVGTLKDNLDGTYTALTDGKTVVTQENFIETLTESAWLSSDVLIESLKKYSSAIDDIYDYATEKGITASEAIEQLQGSVDEFGLKAFEAGQEARTFGDAIDSIKDAVSTKWMNIFKTIFGDYTEQKALWTQLSNDMYTVFAEPLDNVISLLEGAFNNNSAETGFIDKINSMGVEYEQFRDILVNVANEHGVAIDSMAGEATSFNELLSQSWVNGDLFSEAVDKYSENLTTTGTTIITAEEQLAEATEIVNQILRGDWGNGAERVQRLTEAGYDAAEMQEYANKVFANGKLKLSDFTDKEIESVVADEEKIAALKELSDEAKEAGDSFNELAAQESKKSGAELMAESFSNAITALVEHVELFREVWSSVFTPMTSEQVYTIIEKIHALTEAFQLTEEKADRLRIIFTGILQPIRFAIDFIKQFVGAFTPLLKIVKYIGNDLINAFTGLASIMGTIFANDSYTSFFTALRDVVDACVDVFLALIDVAKRFVSYAKQYLPNLQSFFQPVTNFLSGIKSTISGSFSGLSTKLRNFKSTLESLDDEDFAAVFTFMGNLINDVKNKIDELKTKFGNLGTKLSTFFSPIMPFLNTIGTYLSKFGGIIRDNLINPISNFVTEIFNSEHPFQTFIDGIKNVGTKIGKLKTTISNFIRTIDWAQWEKTITDAFTSVKTQISEFVTQVINNIKNLNASDIIVAAASVAGIVAISKISDTAKKIGELASAVTTSVSNINKIFKGKQMSGIVGNINTLAKSIAIVTACLVALALVPTDSLEKSGIVLGIVATAMVGLSVAMGLITKKKFKEDDLKALDSLSKYLLALSTSIRILSTALVVIGKSKILSDSSWNKTLQAVLLVVTMAAVMAGMLALLTVLKGPLMGGALALVVIAAAMVLVMKNLSAIEAAMDTLGVSNTMLGQIFGIAAIIVGLGYIFAAIRSTVSIKSSIPWIVNLVGVIASILMVVIALKQIKTLSVEGIEDKMTEIISVLSVVFLAIGVLTVLGRYLQIDKSVAILGVGLVGLIGAIFLVVLLLQKLAKGSYTSDLSIAADALEKVAVIVGMLALCISICTLISDGGKGIISLTIGVAGLIAAMALVVVLLQMMKNITYDSVREQLNILAIIVIEIGALMLAMGAAANEGGAKGIVYVIGVVLALITLTSTMVLLRAYNISDLLPGIAAIRVAVIAIGLICLAIGTTAKWISKAKINIKTLIGMIALLAVAAAGIAVLARYDWGSLLAAAGSVAIVIAAMAGLCALLAALKDRINLGVIGALLVIAGALGVVMIAFAVAMSILPLDKVESFRTVVNQLLKTFGLMMLFVGILAALSAIPVFGQAFMIGMVVIAGALVIISLAIDIFAIAMQRLDSCNLVKIGTDMLTLAEGLGSVGGQGTKLLGTGAGALVLALGVSALGSAAAGAASGITDLATALLTLSGAIDQITTGGGVIGTLITTACSWFGLDLPAAAASGTEAANEIAEAGQLVSNTLSNTTQVGAQSSSETITGTVQQVGDNATEAIETTGEEVADAAGEAVEEVGEAVKESTEEAASEFDVNELITKFLGGENGSFDVSSIASTIFSGSSNFNVSSILTGMLGGEDGSGLDLSSLGSTLSGLDFSSITSGLSGGLSGAFEGVDIQGMLTNKFTSIDWTSATSSIDYAGFTEALTNGLQTAIDNVDMHTILATKFNGLDWTTIVGSIDTTSFSTAFTSKFTEASAAGGDAGLGGGFSGIGTQIATDIVSGMTTTIEGSTSSYSMEQAGKTIAGKFQDGVKLVEFESVGAYIVDGMVNGINNNAYKATAAAQNLANQIKSIIAAASEVASPSKFTMRIGNYIVEGLAIGLEDNTYKAVHSASKMASKTVAALEDALNEETGKSNAISPVLDMSAIYEQIDSIGDGEDWNPVIKPVLDLSGVNPGLKNLNAIVSTKAQNAADEAIQNGSANTAQNIWSPTFNQYNNSPKALSRTEIYRQTKNQFSALKGVMSR